MLHADRERAVLVLNASGLVATCRERVFREPVWVSHPALRVKTADQVMYRESAYISREGREWIVYWPKLAPSETRFSNLEEAVHSIEERFLKLIE